MSSEVKAAAGFDMLLSQRLVASIDLLGKFKLSDIDGHGVQADKVLADLKQQRRLEQEIAVVWVPTQQIIMTQVRVPGKRKVHWMAALPYALEESLTESVDDYHMVALNRDKDALVSAAITSHENMQKWQALLEEMELTHARLVPDCFRIPYNNQAGTALHNEALWQVTEINELKVVRTGIYSGFAAAEPWYPAIKQQVIKQQQTESDSELTVKEQSVNTQSLLSSSRQNALSVLPFSLSVASYAPQSAKGVGWFEWRWVGALSLVLIVVWLSLQAMQTRQFEQQAAYTQAQTEALFKKMFPNIKRIVNIKAQTLTQLGSSGGNTETRKEMMPILQVMAPWFARQTSVRLIELQWELGAKTPLEFKVEAKKSSDLEKVLTLGKQLDNGFSLRLKLNNVTSELAEGVIYVDAN